MSGVLVIALGALVVTALAARALATPSPRRRLQAVVDAMHLIATPSETGLIVEARGERVRAVCEGRSLRLALALPDAPISYVAAARALGDGALLAALLAPAVRATERELSLTVAARGLSPRTLLPSLTRLTQLAERLRALPMADALARHVLDHAPAEARESAFSALCERFPEARATWRCARTLRDEAEHPALVARASAFLAHHDRAS